MSAMPEQPRYGEPRFAEAAGEPLPSGGDPLYGRPVPVPEYASWLQRVGAYLIDGIITGLPTFVLVLVGAAVGGTGGAVLALLGYLAGLAVIVANTVFRQGRTGQSIGKEQVHIRLVRERDGRPVGPGLSFIRQVAHFLDSALFYVGFLWPLWDRKRQTFADKVCGTVVLRGDE